MLPNKGGVISKGLFDDWSKKKFDKKKEIWTDPGYPGKDVMEISTSRDCFDH